MEEFKSNKLRKPTVTTCCGSLNYAVTDGGDICYSCNKIEPFKRRTATAEDMRKNGINVSDKIFEEMYDE